MYGIYLLASHTNNLSSNNETVDEFLFKNPSLVLFRKKDIEWMVLELRAGGNLIEMDCTVGTGKIESHVDLPPYGNEPSLRLLLHKYVSTSICLNIKKGEKETGY